MSKKVSELTSEFDITLQELKDYASKMGIEIKNANSSIEDFDANRIISTINLMKGNSSNAKSGSSKPKIKATPVINRDNAKARPVIPRKAVVPDKAKAEDQVQPAEAEDDAKKEAADTAVQEAAEISVPEPPAPAEDIQTVKADDTAEAPAKAETEGLSTGKAAIEEAPAVSEPAADQPAGNEAKADASDQTEKDEPVSAAAEEAPAPEPAKKVEEEYVNAPNKPMRFKKISDAATEKKKAEELKKRQQERRAKLQEEKKDSRRSGSRDDRRTSKGRDDNRKDQKGQRDRSQGSDTRKQGGRSSGPRDAAPAPAASGNAKSGKGKSKKFFDNKDRDKQSRFDRREDGQAGRRSSNELYDERTLEKQERHKKKYKTRQVDEPTVEELLPEGTIAVTAPITVAGLSEQAEISVSKIIMSMMQMGVMATINQSLDKDAIEMLADDLGLNIVVTEEEEEIEEPGIDNHEDTESELQPRPPIITVMGHVDHGKTSLLDAIRNTNVTAGESGGITQHIGASEVEINGKKIVFLDTPGHEAFTTMRARGAQVTDIAVLVVAADDGVMPQTIESISHAKAANVPIIVAINKMDKPGANPDRVKQELTEHGILVEDWGGDVISVPVSAKKGEGITDLLEMILLQAEVLELRANPDRLAMGTVIEARLDKAKGPVATLLVSNGTLKTGQSVVAGTTSGKIRVMTDFKGKPIRKAGPATAVEILGLSDVPAAGDAFNVVRDDKTAREIAANRRDKMREEVLAKNASMTLDKLFSQIQEGEAKELNLIVKADVQGSVGAIITSLEKLETPEVKINVIHSGVGTINESDVMLAETSNAIIIGFNVRPTTAVTNQAAAADVEIRLYRVIYDIIDEIQDAMKGMLDPEFKEEVLGKAVVRDTFKVPNIGIVAGCYVNEGIVKRNAQIRLVRDGIVIHEGVISSLRRFKDDVREVAAGYECGLGIEKYNDIKPDDVIECFNMVEVRR